MMNGIRKSLNGDLSGSRKAFRSTFLLGSITYIDHGPLLRCAPANTHTNLDLFKVAYYQESSTISTILRKMRNNLFLFRSLPTCGVQVHVIREKRFNDITSETFLVDN